MKGGFVPVRLIRGLYRNWYGPCKRSLVCPSPCMVVVVDPINIRPKVFRLLAGQTGRDLPLLCVARNPRRVTSFSPESVNLVVDGNGFDFSFIL